ncbi:hypothetical protein FOE78_03715 [Microlunatus elymi]|uniref:CHAD domain-containing protein n=1 Tax=Microlunatus elymi TaxID=2596828 RepID=A0A516PVF7_9ACTN|nr:hypothetical protein [Microlunatus elymi]QDP95140.1 hypothetical protein FOE78_03715 [Microlunatus elymi]
MSKIDQRTPLLFDLPFTAEVARLDQPEVGLAKVISLVGRDASYAAEVTLLDVADHRLIRSGVELAHRVIEGRGDWYLRAPQWQPLLPAERLEPFARGDLPDDLADLVLPFRRRGALGPVAAISYERHSFEFRAADGAALARLQDSRITIRRGGVTTARYREVRVEPLDPGLTGQQRDWLIAALSDAGGTLVDDFPELATRLGTPATGLTDYPEPRPIEPDSSFESFVESVLAARLRELMLADLAIRTDSVPATRLGEVVDRLRGELNGLAATLDPEWLAELDEELRWLLAELTEAEREPARLRSLLRRERYLRLLDLLVTAVRGPKVDENAAELKAGDIVIGLLDHSCKKLLKIAGALGPGAGGRAWMTAAVAAEETARIDRLAALVAGKKERRVARRLRPAIKLLLASQTDAELAAAAQRQARFATAAEAFELGRDYQRLRQRQHEAERDFLRLWPRIVAKVHR